MLRELIYDIESDGDGHFLLSLNLEESTLLGISEEVYDKIESFGITTAYYDSLLKDESEKRTEYICSVLYKAFSEIWDTSESIPYFRFRGNINQLNNKYHSKAILMYLPAKKDNAKILDIWLHDLKFLSKVIFLSNPSMNTFSFISTEHQHIFQYLSNLKNSIYLQRQSSDKYDFKKKMHSWYKDNLEDIVKLGKEAIDTFVLDQKFDVYIPEFVVLSSYRVKRYQTIMHLINNKYNPDFVMTLPCTSANKYEKEMIVVFPITWKR